MARSSTTRPPGNGAGRGGPAKGAGKGEGWGGPARGASASRIKPGDPDGIQAMSSDPDVKARQAARVDELKDHLYSLATGAERQETQLAATVAYLNRVEGMPVQRQVVATVTDPNQMTDAELAAIAAGGRTSAAEAPADTGEPDRVVN